MRIVNQNQYLLKSVKTAFLLFLLIFQTAFAQQNLAKDSLSLNENTLKVKQFFIPSAFVATGFVLLYDKKVNENIKNSIQKNNSNFKISIDNYSQFAPGAAVFALNAFGIKGKHDYKDAALIYAGSIAIATVFVLPLKAITKEERPDFSANNSFPSGHTAIAFGSAEFL